jgi:hypothetical protein
MKIHNGTPGRFKSLQMTFKTLSNYFSAIFNLQHDFLTPPAPPHRTVKALLLRPCDRLCVVCDLLTKAYPSWRSAHGRSTSGASSRLHRRRVQGAASTSPASHTWSTSSSPPTRPTTSTALAAPAALAPTASSSRSSLRSARSSSRSSRGSST